MAPKKKPGTALVKWDEEFANLAQESAKGLKTSEGKFLSFKSGKMSFGGADIPDNELRCVVIGWTHHNVFYDPTVRYDPNNPQSPICYAFGTDEDLMEPHSEAPDKQCDNCAECPLNQFESADNGKGKACKNSIRLALIAESDLEDLSKAEIVYASIPTMSIKNWSMYVGKTLKALKRPHWSVITLLSCVPDAKSQFKINFQMEELIEDADLFGPLKDLWTDTSEGIDFPYQVLEGKVKPTKKKAVGKQKFAR